MGQAAGDVALIGFTVRRIVFLRPEAFRRRNRNDRLKGIGCKSRFSFKLYGKGEKRMKQRNVVYKGLTLLTLAAMLALTACGNGGANNGESSTARNSGNGDPNAPVKLKIMWQGADIRHQAMLKTQAVYTSENPSVTFSPEYMAWDDYWKKPLTLAASHSPDVLHMDGAYIQEYATRGTLEDLSDIDLTGVIDDKTLENLKIDGKLYGIPISRNAQGMAFNKEALEAAGIELPKKDWTWDEYFDFARNARAKLPKAFIRSATRIHGTL